MASDTIIASGGSYTHAGQNVITTKKPIVITASGGSYAYTGQSVTTTKAIEIVPVAGSFLLTGNKIFFALPRFIKGESLLVAERVRFIKGDSSLVRETCPFIKGDVSFLTFSRFIKGDSLLLAIASRYIKGDVDFVVFTRFVKGNATLMRQPPLFELGPSPAVNKAGLLSRHWLSLASVKKEVT